jgi:N-acetylneuraminic acid mutarotase
MRIPKATIGCLCLALTISSAPAATITWSNLPDLPDPEGYAGMFAGTLDGRLIAAGGHRFKDGIPWWDGGHKVWSDTIYTMDRPTGKWVLHSEKLPRSIGDGVAVSYEDSLICVGGGDSEAAYSDAYKLSLQDNRIMVTPLPPLPSPRLRMGGVLVGSMLYLVGGRDSPKSTHSLHSMIALDLALPPSEQRWISLPPWPGPSRMMPVVSSTQNALYVFGGIEIVEDEQGKPKNVVPYLADAYRYQPGPKGQTGHWFKLENLPHPVAGAPSPAWQRDDDTILIFGGVDGTIEAINDRSSVRSLPDDILAYHISKNKWSKVKAPSPPLLPRVNAPSVSWEGGYAIINGEFLPARRTNKSTLIYSR